MPSANARVSPHSPTHWRWLLAACIVAVLLPFSVTTVPPSIDLPQHLAQIRLALDTLRGDPAYVIQWGAPNTLVYAVLGAWWSVLPPIAAGRAATATLALAWAATGWLLARSRGRSPGVTMLVTALAFHHGLYWGFLNFVSGWPLFVAWLLANDLEPDAPDDGSRRPMRVAMRIALGVGLYFAHVLWLAIAVLWVMLSAAVSLGARRNIVHRGAPLVPALLAAAWWSARVDAFRRASGFDMRPFYFHPPWTRLSPTWLVDTTFSGVWGAAEGIAWLAIALWITAGLLTAWRARAPIDRTLGTAALLLGGLVMLAPDKVFNTLFLPNRFASGALTLALVAVPTPVWRTRLLDAAVGVVFAVFVASTTLAWHRFGREDLDGLHAALDAVPFGSRIVGVDYARTSRYIRDEPFFQMFAYGQVLHGGTLAFSFVQHGTGLVRALEPSRVRNVGALPGRGIELPPRALEGFDFVLIDASDPVHVALARHPALAARTQSGRWRLYAVRGLR